MATHNGAHLPCDMFLSDQHTKLSAFRVTSLFLTINGDDYSGMGFDAHATAPLNGLTLANKALNNMELEFMPNGNSGLAE
ncbi:hypothetical protein OHD37_25630 [Escherichia coli]|nr:hypothetical protein [Escherichia coli]MCW7419010.1 hypothetical protein [Escherichia coli]